MSHDVIPPARTAFISFRVSEDLKIALEHKLTDDKRTTQSVLTKMVRQYVDQPAAKKGGYHPDHRKDHEALEQLLLGPDAKTIRKVLDWARRSMVRLRK
jgi:hypothetical protein